MTVMSLMQHHISPKLPTVLADRASVELPGQDLLFGIVRNVHIVQKRLDVPTFEEALSKTLALYPHAAGQLRCDDGRWFIELTNTPVPVDIEYKIDTTSDMFLNGDWVTQDDLSPFLSQGPITRAPNNDSHLVRLKLTFFENETSIGLSWQHTLGDGALTWRFMHTISQFYQGLPLGCTPPTFEKYHFPTPTPSVLKEFWPHLPHLHTPITFEESIQFHVDAAQNYLRTKWRVDDDDLANLRSVLSSRAGNNSLSKQDCLSAYVIAAMNHTTGQPIQTLVYTFSYRYMNAPFVNENVGGNMILHVPTIVPSDMAGIAAAIRETLQQYKDPGYIHNISSITFDDRLQLVNTGKKSRSLYCDDVTAMVNSTTRIDWCGVHFGCPDGSRFFQTGFLKHWVNCFRSNPVKGEDGVWRARRSVDVSIAARAELKPKLLETLARGSQYILDGEDAKQTSARTAYT